MVYYFKIASSRFTVSCFLVISYFAILLFRQECRIGLIVLVIAPQMVNLMISMSHIPIYFIRTEIQRISPRLVIQQGNTKWPINYCQGYPESIFFSSLKITNLNATHFCYLLFIEKQMYIIVVRKKEAIKLYFVIYIICLWQLSHTNVSANVKRKTWQTIQCSGMCSKRYIPSSRKYANKTLYGVGLCNLFFDLVFFFFVLSNAHSVPVVYKWL